MSSNTKPVNAGCGKPLSKGQHAWDRWGILLCDKCNELSGVPYRTTLFGGNLLAKATCGDRLFVPATIQMLRRSK